MNRTQAEQRHPWYERRRAQRLAYLYHYYAVEDDAEFERVLKDSLVGKQIAARYELEKALDPFIGWLMERITA